MLFYPSLACGLNEVTSLFSHPPSFCWEEMLRTHSARPITAPRRRVSSSFTHPHRPLSCLLRFAVLCSPLASFAQETESQLCSQSAGSSRLSRSSNHEPADISVWSSKVIPPPPPKKKSLMRNDSSNVRLPAYEKLLNLHFACC